MFNIAARSENIIVFDETKFCMNRESIFRLV